MRPRPSTLTGLLLFMALLAPHPADAGDRTSAVPAPGAPPAGAPPAAVPGESPAAVPPGGGAPDERAAKLYLEANAFYDEGKYKESEAKYQAAWDIQKSFDVAGNLGNVEMLVGQPRDAAEHLTYALSTFPLGGGPDKKKFIQKRLAEAKKQIGTLQVSVNVVGADVLIDGKLLGKSPLVAEVFIEPGERVVEARFGGRTASESILVARASSQQVVLAIDTGPDMRIVIAGGAAGVVGIGLGLTFTILSNGKAGDAEDLKGTLEASGGKGACNVSANKARCDELSGLRDDEALFGNGAVWSFIGGGTALAATTVYFLVARREEQASAPESGVRVAPAVIAGGGGLVIDGRW